MKTLSSAFLLSTTSNYLAMTRAMINSLGYFHPGIPIILFIIEENESIEEFKLQYPFIDVRVYDPPRLSFGDWHPLVWAKLEAFRFTEFDLVIALDVDQIMYNPLDKHIQKVIKSTRPIGAAPDDDTFQYQFLSTVEVPMQPAQALNAGILIVKPDKLIFEELIQLANAYHIQTRFLEQSILNLYAAKNNAWENLGHELMAHPYSDKVLESPQTSSLIHFWTPRPSFFGANPIRKGEMTYSQAVNKFRQTFGIEYPEKRFKKDFINRLNNKWPE